MAATNIIKYGSRTFGDIKSDLISYVKKQYPEIFSDFTDSNVGEMLIDLNAGVANNLSINTDRSFQETQLEYAQQYESILNIATNLGFKIPPNRPSVTLIDFTVTVPVYGDGPDTTYYPTLSPGAQVTGGGLTFETQDTVDWSSPTNSLGDSNRMIVPVYDSNGIIQSYNVTKREVVINGSTNIYKKVITSDNVIPFYAITLPDPNVIDVEAIILKEGTNYTTNPTDAEFNPSSDGINGINYYYEVDYLAQQKVFTDNLNAQSSTGNTEIKAATWKYVTKKFIKEYTANGYCKITFGSGDSQTEPFVNGFIGAGITNREFLDNFLNNTALGEELIAGNTLYVKYRVGGGSRSNIGSNSLTSLGFYQLNVVGARQDYNQNVKRSLTVNNPIPAMGGNDTLSVEQIRNLIKYNFSAQNRDVTLTDYLLDVYKMPGKYGSPFRANSFKLNNKVIVSVLGLNTDGTLSNQSNSLLKGNIAEYLSGNRMVNDYIEIRDGKIFNLAFDIDVYVENVSNTQIANNIINVVSDYMDVNNYEMNTDLVLGELYQKILAVNQVINIIKITVYNKVGGSYSNNAVSQEITNTTTGEINIINNTIYSTTDSMFEIKYPTKDIKVYLRKKVSNI